MSLIVRLEEPLAGAEANTGSGRGVEAATRRWTTIAFHPAGHAPAPEANVERFRLEAVSTVRGPTPREWSPGLVITRRELIAARSPGGDGTSWSGLFEAEVSSRDDEANALVSRWRDVPFRVALLLACKHAPRFWSTPGLGFEHCGLPGPTRIGRAPFLAAMVRRLHRTPNPEGRDWDTFAYFEMLPTQVAHLREYLVERRAQLNNVAQTPAYDLLERQVELWLVKDLRDSLQPHWPRNA